MIGLPRVYEHSRTHGARSLVERLWPRGIKKESLHNNAAILRDYLDERVEQR